MTSPIPELLPCPFCGSHATLDDDVFESYQGTSITCDNNDCPVDLWVWGFSSREQATERWNTRATLTAAKQDVERKNGELRQRVKDLERMLFLASNEAELRHMEPVVWMARWEGKVAAFREQERRAEEALEAK